LKQASFCGGIEDGKLQFALAEGAKRLLLELAPECCAKYSAIISGDAINRVVFMCPPIRWPPTTP